MLKESILWLLHGGKEEARSIFDDLLSYHRVVIISLEISLYVLSPYIDKLRRESRNMLEKSTIWGHRTYDSLRGGPSWSFHATIKMSSIAALVPEAKLVRGEYGVFHPLTRLAHFSRGVRDSPREDKDGGGLPDFIRRDEIKKKEREGKTSF